VADHVIARPAERGGWQLPGLSTPIQPEQGEPRMRRQNQMTHEEVIAYNLRGGGNEFTEFEYAQTDRVLKAREIIDRIGMLELIGESATAKIVEPGCSTGDISGWFSQYGHEVIGIDVTPGAAAAAKRKWPRMTVIEAEIESLEPIDCDILVLCEFMEHITDPVGFIKAWLPKARYVVIGHPLVGDGGDPEPGHPWAYYDVDFANWFPMGGHELREAWEFPMGYRMVIGWGKRA
jgi:hypothetical protein